MSRPLPIPLRSEGYRSLVRRVTGPKGHWYDIYVECNDQVNTEHYHMIDVSGDSVRQSQHTLTLTLTLNPKP